MCYSEKLADQAAAYQTETGWVYRAWKVVAVRDDGVLRPLHQVDGWLGYSYSTETLLRDKHGFHVGATAKGALQAALNYLGDHERKSETALAGIRRLEGKVDGRSQTEYYCLRLVRCLVPSESIGDGYHAHAMIMLAPRQKETDALVELADRENRRLRRKVNAREEAQKIAIEKLRACVVTA